ncbi:MAG TPA: arginase family protein, partial [Anaerolineae bacterium]
MIRQPKKFTVLGVPIDSSGRSTGVERLPAALRAAGLVRRLRAEDLGDLQVAVDDPERDPATGIIGFESVRAASAGIQSAVSGLLAEGRRPLLLGGDCTLLIGVAAALKSHFGAAGLAFIDGHLDFYDGRSSPIGEAADMELAILSGLGPAGLIDLAGPAPLMAAEHVAVIGYRDAEQAQRDGAPDPAVVAPAMSLYDVTRMRQRGMVKTARAVATHLVENPGRFWLHLD